MTKDKNNLFKAILALIVVVLMAVISCTMPVTESKSNKKSSKKNDTNNNTEITGISELSKGSKHNIYIGAFDSDYFSKTPDEVYDKLKAMKKHFFDSSSYKIYFTTSDGKYAYICDLYNDDVRTEGMSWGMMMCVQMNLRTQFDLLWKFAKKYMWHTDNSEDASDAEKARYGYFSWRVKKDGSRFKVKVGIPHPLNPSAIIPVEIDDPRYLNPAPDGEQYFAMALYLATSRWGDDKYKKDADKIINEMLYKSTVTFKEVTPDPEKTVKVGNETIPLGKTDTVTIYRMFNVKSDYKIVCFSPVDDCYGDGPTYSDPSYVMPAFYEYFSKYGLKDTRAKWKTIALNARRFLAKACNSSSGLCADYTDYEGKGLNMKFKPDPDHNPNVEYNRNQFCWDARRVPMNMGVSAYWYPDADESTNMYKRIVKLNTTFSNGGLTEKKLGCVYNVDGTKDTTTNWNGDGLEATVAASCIYHPKKAPFYEWPSKEDNIKRLWNQGLYTNTYDRYYGGCLYMLGFLVTTGNFCYKDWKLDLSNE